MRCPYCQAHDSRVVESRASEDQSTVRRRRECVDCQRRFTTYERVELAPLMVVKKDRSREEFDRDKLRRGILRACEKRPLDVTQVEGIVDDVERQLRVEFDREVPSTAVGERVMTALRAVDGVAYVRFASVYREFRDVETFAKEILQILQQGK
ncbi:MAG: transcriptional regulator NrdR [Firmicutes bacterium]|nr:transcriptional regulator NrdR [Bacillota bacterium]